MELFKQGEYAKAAEKLVKLLDFDPTNAKAWNALGICMSKLEDYSQSRTCFLNAVRYGPDNQTYLKNLTTVTDKIAKQSYKEPEYSRIKKLKRTLTDFNVGKTEYACLALGLILLALYAIPPALGVLIPSPAREIIGLCGILFMGFFVITSLMKYLQYLGVKRVYFVVLLAAILILAYPIFHLLNLPLTNGVTYNLSDYQNQTSQSAIPPLSTPAILPPVPVSPEPADNGGKPGDQASGTRCPQPDPSFEYEIISIDPFQVHFTDTSDTLLNEPLSAHWDFGDLTGSTDKTVTHEYDSGPGTYQVNLTVENECREEGSIARTITPVYANITPSMGAIPDTGTCPLVVSFSDRSVPSSSVTSWRWSFGDGEVYETTNPANRNVTHTYTRGGTYYATLMVRNQFHQEFSSSTRITVLSSGSISGYLWNDENRNGIRDAGEINQSGWQVFLEKQQGGGWLPVETTSTSSSGTYRFTPKDTGGVYRVRVISPASGSYEITNPDNEILFNASAPVPLFEPGISHSHAFGIIPASPDRYHEVSLISSRQGNLSAGIMGWRQTRENGTIILDGAPLSLKEGGYYEMSLLNASSRPAIDISGGLIARNLSMVSVSADGKALEVGNCSRIESPSVGNWYSTCDLVLSPVKGSYISLIWDGTEVPVSWRETVRISGLMPSEDNRMELDTGSDRVFLRGRAESYELL